MAHFRVPVAWIWGGGWLLFSLHRWCSTRGIHLVKHAVSGSWCPVGPLGGRGVAGHGEFRRNTLSSGTPQGLSSCTSPSSWANLFSVGPSWPRFCCQGWLCDVMSCTLLCSACPCVFVSVYQYQKEGLLLSGGMRGISGATVDGVFCHVIKIHCPWLDLLNEGFRPQTWQAQNIVRLDLERKTCMDSSSKSILKSKVTVSWTECSFCLYTTDRCYVWKLYSHLMIFITKQTKILTLKDENHSMLST